jgi:hypothetical protein
MRSKAAPLSFRTVFGEGAHTGLGRAAGGDAEVDAAGRAFTINAALCVAYILNSPVNSFRISVPPMVTECTFHANGFGFDGSREGAHMSRSSSWSSSSFPSLVVVELRMEYAVMSRRAVMETAMARVKRSHGVRYSNTGSHQMHLPLAILEIGDVVSASAQSLRRRGWRARVS